MEGQSLQIHQIEVIRKLTRYIVHDFNNLLTAIQGHVQLAMVELPSENSVFDDLKKIQHATDRAAYLIHQLLTFSRPRDSEIRTLNLNDLIRETYEILRCIMREDVEVLMALDSDLASVRVDPGQLEQILASLALGFRDAMRPRGKLVIQTANAVFGEHADPEVIPGRYVMMAVRENGLGARPSTETMGRSEDLDLSIVHEVVKQHGGYVRVCSDPGKGRAFKIYLPRAEGASETLSDGENHNPVPQGSETVLLVDDEDSVRTVLAGTLSQQGYRVLEAGDGEEALSLIQRHREGINLLLTDLMMPEMNGKDLAGRVKASQPSLKVLFMSGSPDPYLGENLLQKPFTLPTLVRRVRHILDT